MLRIGSWPAAGNPFAFFIEFRALRWSRGTLLPKRFTVCLVCLVTAPPLGLHWLLLCAGVRIQGVQGTRVQVKNRQNTRGLESRATFSQMVGKRRLSFNLAEADARTIGQLPLGAYLVGANGIKYLKGLFRFFHVLIPVFQRYPGRLFDLEQII